MDARTDRDVTREPIVKLIKLPDLFSLLNAVLGFSALIMVLGDGAERAFKNALVVILFAAVIDGLDGMVARTIAHSPLGVYLDSLADLLSFGLAPAVVVYLVIMKYGALHHTGGVLVLVCCGAYVLCGMLRLARFNANFSSGGKGQRGKKDDFIGFPITGSATFLTSTTLMAIELDLLRHSNAFFLLGFIMLMCVLMISRVPYRAVQDKRIILSVGVLFSMLFGSYLLSFPFICPLIGVIILVAFYMSSPLFLHTPTRVGSI